MSTSSSHGAKHHISTQMNVLRRQTHSTSTTSATEPHLLDGVNTHCTHQNDNYRQCISL